MMGFEVMIALAVTWWSTSRPCRWCEVTARLAVRAASQGQLLAVRAASQGQLLVARVASLLVERVASQGQLLVVIAE